MLPWIAYRTAKGHLGILDDALELAARTVPYAHFAPDRQGHDATEVWRTAAAADQILILCLPQQLALLEIPELQEQATPAAAPAPDPRQLTVMLRDWRWLVE
jgi:hypothetical protein